MLESNCGKHGKQINYMELNNGVKPFLLLFNPLLWLPEAVLVQFFAQGTIFQRDHLLS